jgi:hypothetical protein
MSLPTPEESLWIIRRSASRGLYGWFIPNELARFNGIEHLLPTWRESSQPPEKTQPDNGQWEGPVP